jgi:hypothetical protein
MNRQKPLDKLFNEKKYDLGEVGRYKINYRLGLNIDWENCSN